MTLPPTRYPIILLPAMPTARQAAAKPPTLASTASRWEKLEGHKPVRQQEQAKAQKIERDNSPGMSR